jgi:hypothetical protein
MKKTGVDGSFLITNKIATGKVAILTLCASHTKLQLEVVRILP